jgi:hypothetical protein
LFAAGGLVEDMFAAREWGNKRGNKRSSRELAESNDFHAVIAGQSSR